MTGALACSAPGKLALVGEYSVLFGHPAAVMAVDRRARVELRPSPAGWQVRAPGLADRPAAFELGRDGVVWVGDTAAAHSRFGLVEQVMGWLPAAGGVDPGALAPASLVLDTRQFFHEGPAGPVKLGLGSSAALTVSLAAAVLRWADADPPDLDRLLALHRRFQGGRGSGVDLAAGLLGGVLEYRLGNDGSTATAVALELPPRLSAICVWTGRSASTSAFLEQLDARRAGDDGAIDRALAGLGAIARRAVEDLGAGNVAAWLDDVDAFADGLGALGRAAGLEILSAEHLALRRVARDCGVRYKPSGAGGGDVGIAFTDDADAGDAFAAAAADAGFSPLDLALDPTGLVFDQP